MDYRLLRCTLISALIILLGACSSGAKPGPTRVVPGGVIVPNEVKGGTEYRGLYVARSTDLVCCLTKPQVDISTYHRAGDKNFVLVFYVPGGDDSVVNWFARHPISLIVTPLNQPAQKFCCFSSGMRSVRMSLPPLVRAKSGIFRFRLQTEPAFTPFAIDPKNMKDRRSLGIILQRVFFY